MKLTSINSALSLPRSTFGISLSLFLFSFTALMIPMQVQAGRGPAAEVQTPSDVPVAAPSQPASPKATVAFINLKDSQTIPKKFKVKFAVTGMKIRPALEDVADKTTGHHHLIIDGKPIPAGNAVPTDATHIHFGKGQGETEIELTPGKHTLTLQFADGAHLSYGEGASKTITVYVK
jgi:hypothetical protein